MIFKTRQAFQEEVAKRVAEEQGRMYIDRRLNELEEQIHKLRWRVDQMEASRAPVVPVNPINPVNPCIPVKPIEITCTTEG